MYVLSFSRLKHAGWILMKAATDDPDVYHGAPVGIQIVGRKYEEEKIWAIAKIVERILEREGIE